MAEPTSAPTSIAAPATSAPASSTPASSGSTSTSDIAADVIADFDGDGSDDGGSTPPVAPAVEASATPAAQPATPVDPDDFDAIPAETVDSLGRKRTNNIPHTRVKTMITKREQALLQSVAKELGMTPAEGTELKIDDIITTVKGHGTKRTADEARLTQMDAVERLIETNPDKFMEIISNINPVYKEFARKAAEATAAPVVVEDSEPQPDYDLGNGQMTYSLKGLQELRKWERRQAVKEVEGKLDGRLKPFEERAKAEKEREEYQQWHNETTKRLNERLARAREWPKFKENEEAILKAMQDAQAVGGMLPVEDAYMKVVVPGLASDRTKIRQEVLAEIEAQPKTSSIAAAPAPKPAEVARPKSTSEIAREVIASMR